MGEGGKKKNDNNAAYLVPDPKAVASSAWPLRSPIHFQPPFAWTTLFFLGSQPKGHFLQEACSDHSFANSLTDAPLLSGHPELDTQSPSFIACVCLHSLQHHDHSSLVPNPVLGAQRAQNRGQMTKMRVDMFLSSHRSWDLGDPVESAWVILTSSVIKYCSYQNTRKPKPSGGNSFLVEEQIIYSWALGLLYSSSEWGAPAFLEGVRKL